MYQDVKILKPQLPNYLNFMKIAVIGSGNRWDFLKQFFLDIVHDCTATSPHDWGCCKHKAEKCGENEGDCDDDSQCQDGLICGTNNCPTGSGSNFGSGSDCCTKMPGISLLF